MSLFQTYAHQLFYSSIKKGQYYESLEYFEVFFSDGDSFIKTDSNLYLYLLSLIIEVPEKYKKHLLTLNYEALKIKPDDIRVKNLELENVVRKYIFEKQIIIQPLCIFIVCICMQQ